MPKWRYLGESPKAPPHLPPPEKCIALEYNPRGIGTVAVEMFDTPVDENGIPNPYETLQLLASFIDRSYILPPETNVHHQVHFRTEYTDPVESAYRNSYSLMMDMPVQMHNLDHKLLIRAKKPDLVTMKEYVKEQDSMSLLFALGSAAIRNLRCAENIRRMLPVQSLSDRQDSIEHIQELEHRAKMKRHLYEKKLGKTATGRLNLMPDPEVLARMGMAESTTYLGKIGGNKFLDFRRTAQEFIYKYGINQSIGNTAQEEGMALTKAA